MEISEHIEHLAAQGELLSRAARRTPLTAPVPSCPGWQLRDLLAHIGYVHRWATAYVAQARPHRVDRLGEAELLRAAPAWTVVMGRPGARAGRGADPAAPGDRYCEVSGPAADLYLALWNRRPPGGLDVRGDREVLATWLDRVQVRWG